MFLIQTLARFVLGKEVSLAIGFVQDALLLFESIQKGRNPDVAPFAIDLFQLVPSSLKAPKGTATQDEFIDAIYAVFKLFMKPATN